MTPYIPIPSATSQRAHAAAGHVSRVKSAATGASTLEALRNSVVHIDLAIEQLRALKGEVRGLVGRKK